MKWLPIFFVFVGLGLLDGSATTQAAWYRAGYHTGGYGGGRYYGGGGGYYGGLAALGGGYSPVSQQGTAAIIRSSGQAAKSYSEARINNESAYSMSLDNAYKRVQTNWSIRRYASAQMADVYAYQHKRDKWLASQRDFKPETLPPSQFDKNTGSLEWPDVLQAPVYADKRAQIENELELQATTGSTSNSTRIRNLAREMQSELKDHIRDSTPNEYLAGRKFLDRLVNQISMAQAG